MEVQQAWSTTQVRDADNFDKIWSACGQHEIQYTKWRMKKYKACSKKDRTFVIKTLFYNILSNVPSTGDTPFPTFLPLLEWFLERTFCGGAQFSYRIFLNPKNSLCTCSVQRM